jgi:WD40 repeat protein
LLTGGPMPPKLAPLVRAFEQPSTTAVFGLALLPDGKTLLGGGADQWLRAWDTTTGRISRTFGLAPAPIRSLAADHRGVAAATGGQDGTVRLWDLALGKEAFQLGVHSNTVRALAFSPNDYYVLAGDEGGMLRLWDISAKSSVRDINLGQTVTAVAFHPDGKRCIAGTMHGAVTIIDLDAPKILHTSTGHTNAAVTGVAISPDGKDAVSVGTDRIMHFWIIATGARRPTTIRYPQSLQAVGYAGDGSWAVAAVADSSAAIVQPRGKGRARLAMPEHGFLLAQAVAPDGSAAYFATESGAICRMDFLGGADAVATNAANSRPGDDSMAGLPSQPPKWSADSGAGLIRTLAVAGNGRVVTGGADRTVRVREPDGKEIHTFTGMASLESNVAISHDGTMILVSGNTPTPLGRVTVPADCLLRAIVLKTGKATPAGAQLNFISAIAISPNGRQALTGCEKFVRYWDAITGRELRIGGFSGHTGIVHGIDFHPKLAQAVSVASDKTARVWDVSTGKTFRTIEKLPGLPRGVAYSPDGRAILIWGTGILGTWDAVTGQSLVMLADTVGGRPGAFDGANHAGCWTPDGNIITGGIGGVTLVDAKSGKELRQFDHAPEPVEAVGVSGDGHWVYAAGRGLCAWELDKPTPGPSAP